MDPESALYTLVAMPFALLAFRVQLSSTLFQIPADHASVWMELFRGRLRFAIGISMFAELVAGVSIYLCVAGIKYLFNKVRRK